MSEKVYRIGRGPDGALWVRVESRARSYPLWHVVHHSPTGFEYGKNRSFDALGAAGLAQDESLRDSARADLALSILVDYFQAEEVLVKAVLEGVAHFENELEIPPDGRRRLQAARRAIRLYQEFKQGFLAGGELRPGETISLEGSAIAEWVEAQSALRQAQGELPGGNSFAS